MNTSTITVRNATEDDIASLVAFQQVMAGETEGKVLDPSTLWQGVSAVFHSPEKGFYVVSECEQRVVGTLLVTYEWSDWRNATFWWIQSVYVDTQWRRRGVFRAMYKYVCNIVDGRRDVYGIRLYVERDNRIAQQVYASLGMAKSRYDMYEMDFNHPNGSADL